MMNTMQIDRSPLSKAEVKILAERLAWFYGASFPIDDDVSKEFEKNLVWLIVPRMLVTIQELQEERLLAFLRYGGFIFAAILLGYALYWWLVG
ncbi:MAG: hypothetical protein V3W44_08420 [Dehalococcoidales bacterium]